MLGNAWWPPAHLASDKTELADEGIALRKHDVCVKWWFHDMSGVFTFLQSPEESGADAGKTSDALSNVLLGYVCLMTGRR